MTIFYVLGLVVGQPIDGTSYYTFMRGREGGGEGEGGSEGGRVGEREKQEAELSTAPKLNPCHYSADY